MLLLVVHTSDTTDCQSKTVHGLAAKLHYSQREVVMKRLESSFAANAHDAALAVEESRCPNYFVPY